MKKVGIIGGSGYTGGELIRLVLQHPALELEFVYSTTRAGKPLTHAHPDLLGSTTLKFTDQVNPEIDVVYLCLGHGNSVAFLQEHSFSDHTLIVDLGNDFRLKEDANFKGRNYVYGLPELQRETIEKANAIANPGCFATALQLAMLPIAKNKNLDIKKRLLSFIDKNDNKTFVGYGASIGTTTLIYEFGLGKMISYLFDDEKRRHNLYSPGYKIKVLNPKKIKAMS
mgnify:CR=1 FL=1